MLCLLLQLLHQALQELGGLGPVLGIVQVGMASLSASQKEKSAMVPPHMRRSGTRKDGKIPGSCPQDLLPAAPQASESRNIPFPPPPPRLPFPCSPFPGTPPLPHREGQPGSESPQTTKRRRKGQGAWMVRDLQSKVPGSSTYHGWLSIHCAK